MTKRHLRFIITLYNLQALHIDCMYVCIKSNNSTTFAKTKSIILLPSPSLPITSFTMIILFFASIFQKTVFVLLIFFNFKLWQFIFCLNFPLSFHLYLKDNAFFLPFFTPVWKSESVSRSLMSDSLQPHELYSLPDCSVHGILQAGILEWVAIPLSRGSSRPRDGTWVSCIAGGFFTIWDTRGTLSFTLIMMKWIFNIYINVLFKCHLGTSLAVQWIRLHTSTARGMGLIPGWGTRSYMLWGTVKKKKRKNED